MRTVCAPDNVACMVDNLGHDWTGPAIIFGAMIIALIVATIITKGR